MTRRKGTLPDKRDKYYVRYSGHPMGHPGYTEGFRTKRQATSFVRAVRGYGYRKARVRRYRK